MLLIYISVKWRVVARARIMNLIALQMILKGNKKLFMYLLCTFVLLFEEKNAQMWLSCCTIAGKKYCIVLRIRVQVVVVRIKTEGVHLTVCFIWR